MSWLNGMNPPRSIHPPEAAVVRVKLDPQDCVWDVTTNVRAGMFFSVEDMDAVHQHLPCFERTNLDQTLIFDGPFQISRSEW